nr:hypothetical protein [uncultured Bacillus sp.]
MDKNLRNFKTFIGSSNAVYLLISNVLFGTLLSFVPSGSLITFLIFILITAFEMSLSWVWWKNNMELIRYNSLTAFLLIITMGFFAVMPLFRILSDTILFFLALAMYVLVLVYALYKREMIFQAFDKPEKSKLAKAIVVLVLVLLVLGALSFRYGQEMAILVLLNDYQGAFYVSSFAFIIGLLMTFVSTSLLKKVKVKK